MNEATLSSEPSDEPATVQRPRARRRVLRRLILATCVPLLLVLVAPTALSTRAGIALLQWGASSFGAGTLALDSLSLSWFGGQSLEGLSWSDAAGESNVKLRSLRTELSLWQAVRGDFALGRTEIDGLNAVLLLGDSASDEESSTNPPSGPLSVPPSLSIDAALNGATITLHFEGQEPLTIEGLDAELALASVLEPATFACSAVCRQGDLSGHLDGRGELTDLFAADGTLNLDSAHVQLELDTGDLACSALDRLLQLEGLMAVALGQTVDVRMSMNGSLSQGDFELTVDSPRLTIALAGRVQDGAFELSEPVHIQTTLSPSLVEFLAPGAAASGMPTLREAVPIELAIESLRFPLQGFDPSKVALRSWLRLGGPVRLAGQGPIADLVLTAFSAEVRTDDLGQGVELQCTLELDQGGSPARVQVVGDMAGLFDEQGELCMEGLTGEVVAELSGLSAALLDQLAGTGGLVQELCGPDLGVKLRATSREGGLDLWLALSAAKIDADEIVLNIDDNLRLAEPVSLRMTLDQGLLDALDLGADLPHLAQPLPIELVLTRLEAPWPTADEPFFQPARTQLSAMLRLGELSLTNVPELEELNAQGWELSLEGDSLSALELSLSGTLSGADRPGLFRDFLGSEPLAIEVRAQGGIDADARPGEMQVHLSLASQHLNARMAFGLSADLEGATLLEPAILDAVVTPGLLDRLGLAGVKLAHLSGPMPLRLTIDQLSTSIAGFDLGTLRMQGALHVDAAGEKDPLAVLFGKSLDVTLSLEGTDTGSKIGLHLSSSGLVLDVSGLIDQDQNFGLEAPATLTLVVSPEGLELLGLSDAENPLLARPATVEVRVDELRAALSDFSPATLFTTAQVRLEEFDLPGGEEGGGARLERIRTRLTFDGQAGTLVVALEAEARAPGDRLSSPLAIDARLSNLFHESEFDAAHSSLDVTARLQQVPTALLDAFANHDGALVTLLGPALDVELSVRMEGLSDRVGWVSLDVKGEHIRADLRAKMGRTLELSEPAHLWLELTPQAFAALTGPAQPAPEAAEPIEARAPGAGRIAGRASTVRREAALEPLLALARPATFEVVIESVRWPLPGGDEPSVFDPAAAMLRAALTSEGLELFNPATGTTLALAGLEATIGAASLAEPLEISIGGWLGDPVSRAAGGPDNFELSARVTHAFSEDGALDVEGLAADWTVRVSDLAVAPLDAWAGEDGLLLALLGPQLSLSGSGVFEGAGGSLDVRIDASNARAHVAGVLRDGALHLSEPLTAQLDATPELGRELLSDLHPYLTGIMTDQPITLVVSERGFVLPISPFDLTQGTIERAVLDIGRVTIEGNRALQGLLGIMHRGQDGAIPAWFAPLVISLGDGRVTFARRLDILLDRDVHVATWGSVDLVSGAYSQTLALTSDTLRNVLGLEHVDAEDMLRISIKGTSGSPEIGYEKAGVELARLRGEDAAVSEAERSLSRAHPLAALLLKREVKKLAKKFTRSLARDRSDPPPPQAVNPLPWQ